MGKTNHLQEAKNQAKRACVVSPKDAPLDAQLAIAHALIALVERLDKMTYAPNDSEGPALFLRVDSGRI